MSLGIPLFKFIHRITEALKEIMCDSKRMLVSNKGAAEIPRQIVLSICRVDLASCLYMTSYLTKLGAILGGDRGRVSGKAL